MLAIQADLPNQFLAGGDWLHSNQLDRPQLAGTGFDQTMPVQSLVKHSCSRTAQIGHIYFFDSPCARVLFHEETKKK
jgi:hypothetical protein